MYRSPVLDTGIVLTGLKCVHNICLQLFFVSVFSFVGPLVSLEVPSKFHYKILFQRIKKGFPPVLSRFCHFLGPPEYSDELEFSPPEYSDDVEFSDISACWFWTKNFVTKKIIVISYSRRWIGGMQSKKILQKSKRTFKSLFCL